MKFINRYIIGAFLLISATCLFSGCSKRKTYLFPTDYDLSKTSQVQIFQATVNATRNFVFVDGTRLNGAAMASGAIFPSGSGAIASAITPGLRAFLVRDTLGTSPQVAYSFAENMQPGRNYTIFLYDTITSPKQKTVSTDLVVPSDTTARLRFANFVYNPTAVPNVDVYSFRRSANIFTNIPVTEVTGFIPHTSNLIDTLYIRETGTMNQYVKVAIGPLLPKRSYTAVFRGSFRATTRTVTLFANN